MHEDNDDTLIPLRVMGLSYNQLQNGAYALLLAQVDGPYRIPVVIGAPEAQSIAIALEGIITPRPLTHDLFNTFAQAFGVRLTRVFIYRFEDGIFSAELSFSDGERTICLDARTSDAIALAIRTHAPIFTTPAIIDETGFILADPDDEPVPEADADAPAADGSTEAEADIATLEARLQELIDCDEYEEAARLSAIIRRRKGEAP